MTFAMAAWTGAPQYKARILNAAGSSIATSETLTAAPDANKSSSADVSSAEIKELEFTVTEAGNYIISFTTEGDQELLLLHCVIQASVPTSITLRTMDDTQSVQIYNLSGVKMDGLKPGLNIIRTPDGKTKKVMIK